MSGMEISKEKIKETQKYDKRFNDTNDKIIEKEIKKYDQ